MRSTLHGRVLVAARQPGQMPCLRRCDQTQPQGFASLIAESLNQGQTPVSLVGVAELPASGGLKALRTAVSVQGMTGQKVPFAPFVQAQTRTELPGMVLRRIGLGSKL